MKTLRKKLFAVTSLCLSLACGAALAGADGKGYPDKPVRILVGFPAGQTTDIIARIYAEHLGQALGQGFVVENRPGAGATIAARAVAEAAPDGYTLLMSSSGPLTISPWIYKNTLKYDPIKDLEPIGLVIRVPQVLVANNDFPANTFEEFIRIAKEQGPRLNYASGGNGITNHLVMEMLKDKAGLTISHVPYKGASAAMTDLMGGRVQVMFDSTPVTLPLLKSGKIKALAVSGAKRIPWLPDVPTVAEKGYPGFEGSTWAALLAPAGTPQAIVDKLNAQLIRINQMPKVKAAIQDLGAEPQEGTPRQLGQFMQAELQKYGRIVTAANIRLD
ncbi:tripartite tricarboxylate transporter substrate binding protein [Cupriavidus sp. WS]|uniref:Bug family tripartite tricarboxylate transporter substrate binding protein n=1 Tax=Cupriavidus sp. WS TaxID=1312922 RepID=UPI00037A9123|nr:tripartite tricarboxylate transporter substrate binding protein [Cupriavidus sp. WS]